MKYIKQRLSLSQLLLDDDSTVLCNENLLLSNINWINEYFNNILFDYYYNTELKKIVYCGFPSSGILYPVIFEEDDCYIEGVDIEILRTAKLTELRDFTSNKLSFTDYCSIRQIEEDVLGIPHHIAESEYLANLTLRQTYRDTYYLKKAEIEALTTVDDIKNYNIEF